MLSLRFSVLGLAAFVGACSVNADTPNDADSATSNVVTAYVPAVCAKPQTSPDGKYAVLVVCDDTSRSVQVMATATGRRTRFKTLAEGEEVGLVTTEGPNGDWFSWVTKRAGGNWDVTIARYDDVSKLRVITPVYPADATPEKKLPPKLAWRTVITARHIVFAPGLDGAVGSPYVIVAELGSDKPPVTLVHRYSPSGRLFPSPDGKSVVMMAPNYITDGALSTIDLSTSTPRLADGFNVDQSAIRIKETKYASFDGRHLLVAGYLASSTSEVGPPSAVAIVETSRATVKVLPFSRAGLEVVGQKDNFVWYSAYAVDAGTTASYVIERLDLSRPTEPPLRVFSSATGIRDARLSRDATTLMVVEGSDDSWDRRQLFVTSADGLTPPRLVTAAFDLELLGSSNGRTLSEQHRDRFAILDEITGAETAVYTPTGSLASSNGAPIMSGDGTTLYAARTCDIGGYRGTEVIRVHGDERVVVNCSVSYRNDFIPIPGSSAILHFRPNAIVAGAGEVTLLQP
jgi:hypothetical protein